MATTTTTTTTITVTKSDLNAMYNQAYENHWLFTSECAGPEFGITKRSTLNSFVFHKAIPIMLL